MKIKISGQLLGVLALLCSSLGYAASVTVVASDTNPGIGDTFTITITGAAFPNTAGATLALSYDNTVVSYVSGALPATGPWIATGGSFFLPHGTGADPSILNPGDPFDLLGPSAGAPPSGDFGDALVFTFQAIADGAAAIEIIDNGTTLAWFDADTFEAIPVTYTQAAVFVGTVPPANIVVTDDVTQPDDHDVPFGSVVVASSATATVTITNNGGMNLQLGALTAPAAPFLLIDNMCSGQLLTPGSNCTVDVQFSPVALGLVSSSFDIPSDDADEPTVTVTVSGTGSAGATPNIVVTDSAPPGTDLTIPFGNVNIGQTAAGIVTITNDGSADLTIGGLTGLAAPFTLVNNNCVSQVLQPTESCTVEVQFQPTAAGLVSGTLDIPSDDPDSLTVNVAVNGTGTVAAEPNIAVSSTDLDFGTITVGGSSTQTVTVNNNGAAGLIIGQIALDTGTAFDLDNDTCSNSTVAVGNSCTFDVLFEPVAAGVFNDSLDIQSNDPDSPTVTVNASGTGTAAMVPDIRVTDVINPDDDLRLPFGYIEENTTRQRTLTITNDGSLDLVLGQVGGVNAVEAPFTLDVDGCSNQTLGPTESCTITIGFAPPGIDVFHNDSFDIPSNDPDSSEASVNFALSGGAQPGLRTDSPGESALDPWTLLGLGLVGVALKRRRRAGA